MQGTPGRRQPVTEDARMAARTDGPKGDDHTRTRVQRLRERRKQAGWQPYELWLDPETSALLIELKQPGEAVHALVRRALRTLAQVEQGRYVGDAVSPVRRKARLLPRLLAWQAEGLGHQAMADRLNAEEEPTLTGRGRWHGGTIGKLLKQVAD
jgi:hypothetical protein